MLEFNSVAPLIHDDGLWQDPTMSVERTDTEAEGKFVILIPKLLESIRSTIPPQRAHFYFDTSSIDYSIRFVVGRSCHIESFSSQISCNQLFANRTLRPGWMISNPGKGTVLPSAIIIVVIVLKNPRT